MTRYLLDTNIVSNLVKPQPSQTLMVWMSEQRDLDLFISTLTLAEIQRGILQSPKGKKRAALETWFAGPDGPSSLFAGRILNFDVAAAAVWAQLMAQGQSVGAPRSPLDMIVAAIGLANDCILVTDNEKDFAGLAIINPVRSPL